MKKHIPPEKHPPADFIREELDARGWTTADFALAMGTTPRGAKEIVSGKKAITTQIAVGLAKAFRTSAEIWLNLEHAYQLALLKTAKHAANGSSNHVKRRNKVTKHV